MGRTDWLTAVKDFHFMVMRRFYFSSSRLKWILGRCTGRNLPALHCRDTLTLCPTPHSNVGLFVLFCFFFFYCIYDNYRKICACFNTFLVLFILKFERKWWFERSCKSGFSSSLVYSAKKIYFFGKKKLHPDFNNINDGTVL